MLKKEKVALIIKKCPCSDEEIHEALRNYWRRCGYFNIKSWSVRSRIENVKECITKIYIAFLYE